MPLTKNLYREDEVLASLKFCVLKGKAQEAIFWAQEGLDSGMREDVLESLFWVWALAVGPANPWWLISFRQTLQSGPAATDEEIQYLAMSLLRNPATLRDGTVIALLGIGLRQDIWCEERVGQLHLPGPTKDQLSPQELYCCRGIMQGKLFAAWGRLIPIWKESPQRTWGLLKGLVIKGAEIITLLETAPSWFPRLSRATWTWPLRAAAVAIAAWELPEKPAAPWEPPIEWVTYRHQWLSHPMRWRRLHTPSQLALYWFTERGQMSVAQSTERELMDGLEDALRGSVSDPLGSRTLVPSPQGTSAFWEPLCPELTASDESREAFYDRYFPTDIPDEWTATERQVSHGRGVISDPANTDWAMKFSTTLRMWFGTLPCRLWQGVEGGLKAIHAATRIGSDGRPEELLASLNAAYSDFEAAEIQEKLFVPVRRELVIA